MKRLTLIIAVGIGLILIGSVIAIGITHRASEQLRQTEAKWGQYTFTTDSNLQNRVHTSIALSREVGK